MADWTELDTDNLLPGEPWTSAKALAVFENPKAIAEGAEAAPKIVGAALDVYGGYYNSSSSTWSGAVSIAARDDVIRVDFTNSGTSSSAAQLRFSTDGGSNWGAAQAVTATAAGAKFGFFHIILSSGQLRGGYWDDASSTAIGLSQSITVPSGANAVSFRNSAGSGTQSFSVTYLGGVTP